ncbi:MAG: hypothetical protein QXF12_00530 [Candidatus Aenigmatarchaeota archaeon]
MNVNSTILDLITKTKHKLNNLYRGDSYLFEPNVNNQKNDYFLKIHYKKYKNLDELVEEWLGGIGQIGIYIDGDFVSTFAPNYSNREEITIRYPRQKLEVNVINDKSIDLSYDGSQRQFYAYSKAASEPDDFYQDRNGLEDFVKLNLNLNSVNDLLVQKVRSITLISPAIDNIFSNTAYNNITPAFYDYYKNYIHNINENEKGWFIYSAIKLVDDLDELYYHPVGYDTDPQVQDKTKNPINESNIRYEIYDYILNHNNILGIQNTINVRFTEINIPFKYSSINHTMYSYLFYSSYRGGVLRDKISGNWSNLHLTYENLSNVRMYFSVKFFMTFSNNTINEQITSLDYSMQPIYEGYTQQNNTSKNTGVIYYLPNNGIKMWMNEKVGGTNIALPAYSPLGNVYFQNSILYKMIFAARFSGALQNLSRFSFINYPGTANPQVAIRNVADTHWGHKNVTEFFPIYLQRNRMKHISYLLPPIFSRGSITPQIFTPYRRFIALEYRPRPGQNRRMYGYDLYCYNPAAFSRLNKDSNFSINWRRTIFTQNLFHTGDVDRMWSRFSGYHDYWFFMPTYTPILYAKKDSSITTKTPVMYEYKNESSISPDHFVYKGKNTTISGYVLSSDIIREVLAPINSIANYYYTGDNFSIDFFEIDLENHCFYNKTHIRANEFKSMFHRLVYLQYGAYRNYPRVLYPFEPFYPPNFTAFNYAPVYINYFMDINENLRNTVSTASVIYDNGNVANEHKERSKINYTIYYPATVKAGGLAGIIPGYTLDVNYPAEYSFVHDKLYPPTGILEFTNSLPKIVFKSNSESEINLDRNKEVFNQNSIVTDSNKDYLFTYQYFGAFNPRLWSRPVMYYYTPTHNTMNPSYYTAGLVQYEDFLYTVKKAKHVAVKFKKDRFSAAFFIDLTYELSKNVIGNVFVKKAVSTNDDFDLFLYLYKEQDAYKIEFYLKSKYNIIYPIFPQKTKQYKRRKSVHNYILARMGIRKISDLFSNESINLRRTNSEIFQEIISGEYIKRMRLDEMELLDFPHPVEKGISLGAGLWYIRNLFAVDSKSNILTLDKQKLSCELVEELPDEIYELAKKDKHTIIVKNVVPKRRKHYGLFGLAESLYIKYENQENLSHYLGETITIDNIHEYTVEKHLEYKPALLANKSYINDVISFARIHNMSVSNNNQANSIVEPRASYAIYSDGVYYTSYKRHIMNKIPINQNHTFVRYYIKSKNKKKTVRNQDLNFESKNGNLVFYNIPNKSISPNDVFYGKYSSGVENYTTPSDQQDSLWSGSESSNLPLEANLYDRNQFKNLPVNHFNTNVLLYNSDKDDIPLVVTNDPTNVKNMVFMFYEDNIKNYLSHVNPFSGFHFMDTASFIGGKMYNFDSYSFIGENLDDVPDAYVDIYSNVQASDTLSDLDRRKRWLTLPKQFITPHIYSMYKISKTRYNQEVKSACSIYKINNVFMNVYMPRIPVILAQYFLTDEFRGFSIRRVNNMEFEQPYEKKNYTRFILDTADNLSSLHYANDYKIKSYDDVKEPNKDLVDRVYGRILFPFANESIMLTQPAFIGAYYQEQGKNHSNDEENLFPKADYDILLSQNISGQKTITKKIILGNQTSNRYYKKVKYDPTNNIYNDINIGKITRFSKDYEKNEQNTFAINLGGLVEIHKDIGFHYLGLYSNFVPPIPVFIAEKAKVATKSNTERYNSMFDHNKLIRDNYLLYGTPPNGTPLGASKFIQNYWPGILSTYCNSNEEMNLFEIARINTTIPKELIFIKHPNVFQTTALNSRLISTSNLLLSDSMIAEVYGHFNTVFQGHNIFSVFSPTPPNSPLIFRPFVDLQENEKYISFLKIALESGLRLYNYYGNIKTTITYDKTKAFKMLDNDIKNEDKMFLEYLYNIQNFSIAKNMITPFGVYNHFLNANNNEIRIVREVFRKIIAPFSLVGYDNLITNNVDSIDIDGFYTHLTFISSKMSNEYIEKIVDNEQENIIKNNEFVFQNISPRYIFADYAEGIYNISNNGIKEKSFSCINYFAEKSKYYAGMPFAQKSYLAQIEQLYFMYSDLAGYVRKRLYPRYRKKEKRLDIFFGKKSKVTAGITFLGANTAHTYPHSSDGATGARNYSSFLDKYKGEFVLPFFYFENIFSDDRKYSVNKIEFWGLDGKPMLRGVFDITGRSIINNLNTGNNVRVNVTRNNRIFTYMIDKNEVNETVLELYSRYPVVEVFKAYLENPIKPVWNFTDNVNQNYTMLGFFERYVNRNVSIYEIAKNFLMFGSSNISSVINTLKSYSKDSFVKLINIPTEIIENKNPQIIYSYLTNSLFETTQNTTTVGGGVMSTAVVSDYYMERYANILENYYLVHRVNGISFLEKSSYNNTGVWSDITGFIYNSYNNNKNSDFAGQSFLNPSNEIREVSLYKEFTLWYPYPENYPLYVSNSNITNNAKFNIQKLVRTSNMFSANYYRIVNNELVSDLPTGEPFFPNTNQYYQGVERAIDINIPLSSYMGRVYANTVVGLPFIHSNKTYVNMNSIITRTINLAPLQSSNQTQQNQIRDHIIDEIIKLRNNFLQYASFIDIYDIYDFNSNNLERPYNQNMINFVVDAVRIIGERFNNYLNYKYADPAFMIHYIAPITNINISGHINTSSDDYNQPVSNLHYTTINSGYRVTHDFVSSFIAANTSKTPQQLSERVIFGATGFYGIPQVLPVNHFVTRTVAFGYIRTSLEHGNIQNYSNNYVLLTDNFGQFRIDPEAITTQVSTQLTGLYYTIAMIYAPFYRNLSNYSACNYLLHGYTNIFTANRWSTVTTQNNQLVYGAKHYPYIIDIYKFRNELNRLFSVGSDTNIRAVKALSLSKMSPHVFYPTPVFYTENIQNNNQKFVKDITGVFSYTTAIFNSRIDSGEEQIDDFEEIPWHMDKKYDSITKNMPAYGLYFYKYVYRTQPKLTRLLSIYNMLDFSVSQTGMAFPDRAKIISHGGFPYYEATIGEYFVNNCFTHTISVNGDNRKIGFVLPHPNFVIMGDHSVYKYDNTRYMPEPVYTAPPMSFISEIRVDIKRNSFNKNNFTIKAHRKHLGFRLLSDEKELYWEDLFQNTCFPQVTYPCIKVNTEPFDYHTIYSHGNTNGGHYAPFFTPIINNVNSAVEETPYNSNNINIINEHANNTTNVNWEFNVGGNDNIQTTIPATPVIEYNRPNIGGSIINNYIPITDSI